MHMAEAEQADRPAVRGHAQRVEHLALVGKDAGDERAQSLILRGEEHQHHGHGSVQVPVGNGPALGGLLAGRGLVREGVAVEVRLDVRDGEDHHCRSLSELRFHMVRREDHLPQPFQLIASAKDDEVEALGEACRGCPAARPENAVRMSSGTGSGA